MCDLNSEYKVTKNDTVKRYCILVRLQPLIPVLFNERIKWMDVLAETSGRFPVVSMEGDNLLIHFTQHLHVYTHAS